MPLPSANRTSPTGRMVSALRQMGFDAVFDTNFAADLTILEEGTELLTRLKHALVDKQPVALGSLYRRGGPALVAGAVAELVQLPDGQPDRYLVLPRSALRELVDGLDLGQNRGQVG